MTAIEQNTPDKKIFSLWKVFLPVAIGLTVVVLMFLHDARREDLAQVLSDFHFDYRTAMFIGLAFLCMFGRDFGLSWRFRELTNRTLSWRSAVEVDLLCEFTSCVTPSAVGGSALGMVFLNSKGIEFGKATTLMMTTLFLDELFFVLFSPLMVFLTPAGEIFASGGESFTHGLRLTFWIVYTVLAAYTFLLFVGIIWKPVWISKTLRKLFSWKILRKWQGSAVTLADNMIATSKELKSKSFWYWLKVFSGTALSWTSRFLVVNVLFFGLVPGTDPMQWVIFAREFVIWVVLMVSPTPGGSGLSEWIFTEYYGDVVPTAAMALVLAVFWRVITYYFYLLVGACIVPGWLKGEMRRYKERKATSAA